jgi:hypothetical protein
MLIAADRPVVKVCRRGPQAWAQISFGKGEAVKFELLTFKLSLDAPYRDLVEP